MDECGTDACVAMVTKERVGMTVTEGALAVLVNLLITPAVRMESGGVVKDVGHTAKYRKELHLIK